MFGKFMNKKFFHPGSYPNIRRKWMAEQKAAAKDQKQQEMKEQHAKEQENYQNRVMLAKSESDRKKLDLNFMYDLPPGMKREKNENEDESGEETLKFEWQKGAPKESYATKLGLDVHDQPFGILVRNVKCFKCSKWGHQNTDRECPMYGQNRKDSELQSLRLSDPLRLIADMKEEHGIILKKNVIGREINPMDHNHQILESDDEVDPDVLYIESLTEKEKRKLLKRLNKFENKEISPNSLHKKRKMSNCEKTPNSIILNNSESSSSDDYNKLPKIHKYKKKKRHGHKKLRKYSDKNNESENEWISDDNAKTTSNKHKAKHKHSQRKKEERKRKH